MPLTEVVRDCLGQGPKGTEEVIAECRRRGLGLRDQTIEAFLRLSGEIEADGAEWKLRGADKDRRILRAAEKAFSGGGTYVPLGKLAEHLGEGEEVTAEEIARVCEAETPYRVRGAFVVKI